MLLAGFLFLNSDLSGILMCFGDMSSGIAKVRCHTYGFNGKFVKWHLAWEDRSDGRISN